MKENHLLRRLTLKRVDREKRDQNENALRTKLKCYEEGYAKVKELIESLQKENESWETKLGKMDIKAKYLATLEETLKSYLKVSICSTKESDDIMSKLKDYLVANSNTYFGRAKEHASFFYNSLDPSMLDIFKVICDV